MDNLRLAIGLVLLLLSVGSFIWWMARVVQRLGQCEQDINCLFASRHAKPNAEQGEEDGRHDLA